MIRMGLQITTVMACLGLAGCTSGGVLGLGSGAAPQTYDLVAPKSVSRATAHRTKWQLVVKEPMAVRALETDRILIKPGRELISYYGNAVWSDRLPRLIQVRLIESLQDSGRFRAVGGGRERMEADLGLLTQIRAFQIEARKNKTSAHVSLFVKVMDERRARIIRSRVFEAIVPAYKDNTPAAVEALNQGLTSVLNKIVKWVAKTRLEAAHATPPPGSDKG